MNTIILICGTIILLKCVFIEFTIPNLCLFYFLYIYQKSQKLLFKHSFLLQNTLLILLVCVVNSQRLFHSLKKLVSNASIKVIWYTKRYYLFRIKISNVRLVSLVVVINKIVLVLIEIAFSLWKVFVY